MLDTDGFDAVTVLNNTKGYGLGVTIGSGEMEQIREKTIYIPDTSQYYIDLAAIDWANNLGRRIA